MSKRWHERATDRSRQPGLDARIVDLDEWMESQEPRSARRRQGEIRRRLERKLEDLRLRESLRDELAERRTGRGRRGEADADAR